MNLLALDPGETTGWASFHTPNDRDGYRAGQIKGGALGVWGSLGLNTWLVGSPSLVICESFQYRAYLPKANLTPVEVIGALKVWCNINHVQLEFQTPAQGKFYFTDARLKERQLYQVGKPHANDAMRHLLYYLSFVLKEGNVR